MRQRRTALKHVLSWERLQGSVGEPIPPQSQRQGPKPDRSPHSPTIRLWSRLTADRSCDSNGERRRVQMTPVVLRLMWQPQCLLPRPDSPRSQCRGFFFAGAVVAKEADILSTLRVDATSWQWSGKQGTSTTPSRRSILATAARRSSPSQAAAVASTTEPLASLIVIEYRRSFRMCEVKDKGQLESSKARVFRE